VVVDWKTAGTIFVALVGFLVTYVVNLRLARRKDRLERINEQLRDLYGPLYALEISARSAWMEFRKQYRPDRRYWQDDPPPTAEEAQAWRTWMKSVFMPINRRMRDVVVTKAHLIDGSEMPQSLRDLAAHVSAYEPILARWDDNDFSIHKPPLSFPRDTLVVYLEIEFQNLKERQQDLLKEPLIKASLGIQRASTPQRSSGRR
jgi:hypothetical protein